MRQGCSNQQALCNASALLAAVVPAVLPCIRSPVLRNPVRLAPLSTLRPGGIRQQFKAASPMVEELLRGLKQLPGLDGPLSARVIDDGDAVAAWEGPRLAAVLFPTGETLGDVRRIAEAHK